MRGKSCLTGKKRLMCPLPSGLPRHGVGLFVDVSVAIAFFYFRVTSKLEKKKKKIWGQNRENLRREVVMTSNSN